MGVRARKKKIELVFIVPFKSGIYVLQSPNIIGVVLQVRWSGEHVPGSPFVVMIFDTEEELNRFLQVRLTTPPPPYSLVSFARCIAFSFQCICLSSNIQTVLPVN